MFMKVELAAIDNNLCEQILKRAILHRKNSLFYRNLSGANPFDYLVQLQRHADYVANSPEQWMPWNYLDTLARLESAAVPAG